jgi:glycosyltransferase involved in cell wall biosynthesis
VTLLVLTWVALGCAAVPALLYLWNSFLFREPPLCDAASGSEAVASISVLIPARNEELGIEACVRSVLASQHVELELIVLDDASTDRTAEIVRAIAAEDSRVRLETAPPLPAGWCGKQHACFALSKLARCDTLTFLDADVRLEPDALARMALFLKQSGAELVSGFPRQETGTLLEKLLIPLINWLLLCFLPLWGMRHFRWSAFGAGCGQWFMTTRAAYEKVGGHAAVKASLHDGLTLPRAYRKAGFFTDVSDATNLATCRMYRSAIAVWFGLAKNAREGMAATGQIGFWTVVLLCGQVMPFVLLVAQGFAMWPVFQAEGLWLDIGQWRFYPLSAAAMVALATRYSVADRFGQSRLGVLLHPIAIMLLLAVQWYAIFRAVVGNPVGWKGRTHPTTS